MRRRRVPLPLLVVLAVVLVEGLVWTFAVPALQGADEAGHFAYVQKVAEAHTIPWSRQPALQSESPDAVSAQQRVAWVWAGLEPLRGNLAARPLWTGPDEAIFEQQYANLGPDAGRDGYGNPAFKNPPLYYLAAAVPYKVAGEGFFARLFAVRLMNLPLLLLAVALTWLLAGEIFGRRRALQTVAAAVVGLHPVLLDVTTRVTPDALLVALSAGVLYVVARLVRRGLSWREVALLFVLVAAACFTQGRALGLVVPAVLATAFAWWRGSPLRGRRWGVALVVAVFAAVLVGYSLYATRFHIGDIAGFLSYLWQFYLPALPGMDPPVGPPWGAEQVYLERLFGTFVQFEVRFPRDLLHVIRDVFWIAMAALAVALWRHRSRLRERGAVVVALAAMAGLEILALHAAAFRSLVTTQVDPVITGRYLLVLLPLLGLGVAAALTALPARPRALATGAVLAAAVLLQVCAFGIVYARFYA